MTPLGSEILKSVESPLMTLTLYLPNLKNSGLFNFVISPELKGIAIFKPDSYASIQSLKLSPEYEKVK